jgi:hypothetical protein
LAVATVNLLLPKSASARDEPRDSKFTLAQMLEWLIELFDAWGKEAEAAKWRRELETLNTAQRRLTDDIPYA